MLSSGFRVLGGGGGGFVHVGIGEALLTRGWIGLGCSGLGFRAIGLCRLV